MTIPSSESGTGVLPIRAHQGASLSVPVSGTLTALIMSPSLILEYSALLSSLTYSTTKLESVFITVASRGSFTLTAPKEGTSRAVDCRSSMVLVSSSLSGRVNCTRKLSLKFPSFVEPWNLSGVLQVSPSAVGTKKWSVPLAAGHALQRAGTSQSSSSVSFSVWCRPSLMRSPSMQQLWRAERENERLGAAGSIPPALPAGLNAATGLT
mmetsp:Transcript_44302/g.81197  ORF Transcript_44302/g.81197 Transcript_44302/m.81197 type:complete len:209 (+) Transcript_44302:386-1012(+)